MIDANDPNSFEEAKEELRRVLLANVNEIENIPVMALVNKSDLGRKANCKKLNQIVNNVAKDKRNFAKMSMVSSKTGENISIELKIFRDI